MKRLIAFVFLLLCISLPAAAEIDLSGMSFAELCDLEEQIQEAKKKIALELASEYAAELEEAVPVALDVAVDSVRIDRNSAGTTLVFVVFKNKSSTLSIDRIDFNVRCYDAYGDVIKKYGRNEILPCFYDGSVLNPSAKSHSDHRWTLYGTDGTKEVDIAIAKYHATDGTTIIVPDDQLEWIHF